MLLFAMAQHDVKPIIYLTLNKNISRGKQCVLHPQDSLTVARHKYNALMPISKQELDQLVINELTTNDGLLTSSSLVENQEEECTSITRYKGRLQFLLVDSIDHEKVAKVDTCAMNSNPHLATKTKFNTLFQKFTIKYTGTEPFFRIPLIRGKKCRTPAISFVKYYAFNFVY